jgi:high-affinity nickel permease
MISLLSIIALGFFLGMRHATNPDHVIAVTTIAAHHRTIKVASLIGALWGVGHTLTIIAVGGAIVLLGWAIPARIGLSAEFSVALMLILLGIMNLTGFLKWINGRFSSLRRGQSCTGSLALPPLRSSFWQRFVIRVGRPSTCSLLASEPSGMV